MWRDFANAVGITLLVGTVYTIVNNAQNRVKAGTASPGEKKIVEGFNEILEEGENKKMLAEMGKDAVDLAERKRLFDRKYARYLKYQA